MYSNILYIILIIIFDSLFPIPPTNSEFWLIKYVYNNPIKNKFTYFLYYYSIYIICSLIGGIIGYCIGMIYKANIIELIDMLISILFGYESVFCNLLEKYDPLNILLIKSVAPGVPVSIFNILCGIYKSNIYKFIYTTIIFRSIRFCTMFLLKKYLQYDFITHNVYIFTAVYCSSTIIILLYTVYYFNSIFNIFTFNL